MTRKFAVALVITVEDEEVRAWDWAERLGVTDAECFAVHETWPDPITHRRAEDAKSAAWSFVDIACSTNPARRRYWNERGEPLTACLRDLPY